MADRAELSLIVSGAIPGSPNDVIILTTDLLDSIMAAAETRPCSCLPISDSGPVTHVDQCGAWRRDLHVEIALRVMIDSPCSLIVIALCADATEPAVQ